MQKITLIAAYAANNRCIGKNNTIPWHVPEDFAFFKNYTLNKPVVMGRKTWESLPVKPLPGRRNIVVSRDSAYQAEGAEVVSDIQTALSMLVDAEEIMIMGGAEIYRQTLPLATDLRITEIDVQVDGADAFFPEITPSEWKEVDRTEHQSVKNIGYALVHYVRHADD